MKASAQPSHRVILVGCGHISGKHTAALSSIDNVSIIAVVDPAEERAAATADELAKGGGPRPKVYTQLSDALRETDADLVSILTPSGLHADLANEAIAAGRNVVIEKPLDVDLRRARKVVENAERAASDHGSVISVISQHRFDPATVIVAGAIDTGRFGRVTSGVASLAWWRSQAYYDSGDWRGTWALDGGGATMNQGIHTVDLLLRFLGRPVEIDARTALLAHERVEVEDTAVAIVTFQSGALGVIHMTTAAYPGLTARIQVYGTRGSAVIDNDKLSYFYAADGDDSGAPIPQMGLNGGGNQVEVETQRYLSSIEGSQHSLDLAAHARQYVDVLSAIETGGRPEVGIREGWIATATVRALYLSATLGKPVLLDDVLAGKFDDISAITKGR